MTGPRDGRFRWCTALVGALLLVSLGHGWVQARQAQEELAAAQVLQHLVPLLIILLTFGALAGERDQGTLRQLLATGIGRSDLALGKALGIAGALALLLVPAAVVGAAALVVGSPGPAASPLARGAVLAGVDLSRWIHPTPSAVEFARTLEREMAAGVEGIERPDRAASTERLLAQHDVERVEDLPLNDVGVYLQESEDFGNRRCWPRGCSWTPPGRATRASHAFGPRCATSPSSGGSSSCRRSSPTSA